MSGTDHSAPAAAPSLLDEAARLRDLPPDEARAALDRFLAALEAGDLRAASPDPATPTGWRVEPRVKEGILAAFALAREVDLAAGPLRFRDRDTLLPVDALPPGARVVPGGTAIRRGAHLEPRVVVMPPAYVNVGAWVGEGTLVDSHALVGSCAQIGARVHLSAAAQVGGVLEPVGALPVVVEDDVFVGGNAGIYEGVVVKRRAVLAAGTILTGSSQLHDLVRERVLQAEGDRPLVVPEGAVVVMGARPASGAWARERGLSVATPVIVKYRDERTDAKTALEGVLR
ncbi:MAG TPA: 2,3,4,5-tetrahydropyridine-2,6-dicarboxylate N-succinyltransferase [Thermoanaerobaculia bacterium]|nr:2,3,4,5-tetrahydropyridine-2,6-dicarboxylate N-succinyltransferase [Thermoanaerobaculia bacterium]